MIVNRGIETIKMFCTNITDLEIDVAILKDLEKQRMCKKAEDYYIIKTDILLSGEGENITKFNTMMQSARYNGYTYIQVTI